MSDNKKNEFDPLPWLREEAQLFDEIGEPGAFEHGCKLTAAADEIKRLRQGDDRTFPIMSGGGQRIPWIVAEKAYFAYRKHHPSQSMERIAERGGFAEAELDSWYPPWREESDKVAALQSENENLPCGHRKRDCDDSYGGCVFCQALAALHEEDDEAERLRAECGELREALTRCVEELEESVEFEGRLSSFTAAAKLARATISQQKAVHRGETDFCTHGIDIQKPCEKCRQRSVRAGKPEDNTDRYFPPPKDTALNPEKDG